MSLLQKDGHQEKVLCSQADEFRKNVHDETLGNLISEKNGTSWVSQIQSYVFQPYQPAKDHRIGFESGNVNAVMDGDLKQFIDAYLVAGSRTRGRNAVDDEKTIKRWTTRGLNTNRAYSWSSDFNLLRLFP